MDRTSTVPSASLPVARPKNFIASAAVVALALAFYRVSATNRRYLGELYGSAGSSFTGEEFLTTVAIAYTLALFFLTERAPGALKSLRFGGWGVGLSARTGRMARKRPHYFLSA